MVSRLILILPVLSARFFEWKVPVEKSREATLENRILVHNRCAGGRPRRRMVARKGRERSVISGREQSSGR